jgi:undecaprenyl-diphosphatase
VSDLGRLLLGVTGVALSASVVRRDHVGVQEAAVFRVVNELPDALAGPLWVGMQAGALGAAPVAALAAGAAGRPRLAAELLLAGSGAWVLAKAVKRVAQRPRPVVLLPRTRCRGRPASGLGFVSGHAAVAVALSSAAVPHLGPRGRAAALLAAPVVGLARLHAGNHLPLDVVGGAALGLAVDAAVGPGVRRPWRRPPARTTTGPSSARAAGTSDPGGARRGG